jgi:hypothetical protein
MLKHSLHLHLSLDPSVTLMDMCVNEQKWAKDNGIKLN